MYGRRGLEIEFDDDEDDDDEPFIVDIQVQDESTTLDVSDDQLQETVDKEDTNLPQILAVAFACVLEDTVDQLGTISNMAGLPRIRKKNEEGKIDETLEELKRHIGSGNIFDPEILAPAEEALQYQKLLKFQKDVHLVRDILEQTINNLATLNNFDCLVDKINEYQTKRVQEKNFLESARENREKLENLQKAFDIEKSEAEREIQEKSEEIGKIKDEIENTIFENGVKMRYVSKWENSRTELNNFIIDTTEENYLNKIKTLNTEIEREKRINKEIETYISQTQEEYEDKILEWMERYDTEIEQLDMDIQVIKEKIESQQLKYAEVKNTYEEHRKFVE
ncbi:probable E3 ubiquitin-protein ligase bre1, partial [Agrilus planipennis]